MEIVLLIAFLLSNFGWLYFWDRRDKRDRNERWELRERKDRPDTPKAPPSHLVAVSDKIKTQKPVDPHKPVDEFDLVGRVDPDTPLRRE